MLKAGASTAVIDIPRDPNGEVRRPLGGWPLPHGWQADHFGNITPDPDVPESQRAPLSGPPSVLEDDRPTVTALALECDGERVCIISCDCVLIYGGGVDKQHSNVDLIANHLRDTTNWNIDSGLIVCSTHNHSGVFEDGDNLAVVEAAKRAAVEAIGRLEPAELGHGSRDNLTSPMPTFNRIVRRQGQSNLVVGSLPYMNKVGGGFAAGDRLDCDSYRAQHELDKIDDTVVVVHVRSLSGRTIAIVVNYACHATTFGPAANTVSSDFPGVLRRALKDRFGGETLFLQGAAGDIVPWASLGRTRTASQDASRAIALAIFEAALGIIANIPTFDAQPTLKAAKVHIPIDPGASPPPKGFGYYLNGSQVTATMGSLGSTLPFVAVPGELFTSYGQQLRAALPGGLVIGYANDAIGYIPDVAPDFAATVPVSINDDCLGFPEPTYSLAYVDGRRFVPFETGQIIVDNILKRLP